MQQQYLAVSGKVKNDVLDGVAVATASFPAAASAAKESRFLQDSFPAAASAAKESQFLQDSVQALLLTRVTTVSSCGFSVPVECL
eukprot:5367704-Amphidinium_carterae.1